jgi:predicted lactoylglutathione lyase
MMKQIFINLPVTDLEKSKYFYAQLGFTLYPLFTGDNQACMSWSEHILVMLQTPSFFTVGNSKAVADTQKTISATLTVPVDGTEQLNKIIENAIGAGGQEILPAKDEGFMQVRTIEDLDGHIWAFIHLDMDKFKDQKNKNDE